MLLAAVAYLVGRQYLPANRPAPAGDAAAPPDVRPAALLGGPQPELAAAEAAHAARLAAAKVAQERARGLGEEVLAAAAEGAQEADRWEADVTPVLTGDAGRRLAARPELVTAFRAVYELDRPTRAEFAALTAQAETALAPVRKAAADPASVWDDTRKPTQVLTDLRTEAQAKRTTLREARRRVDRLLDKARRDAADPPLGGPTLQEAVRRLEEHEAEELAAAVHAAREKARAEVKTLLADQAAESVRRAGKAEAAREAARAEVARTKVELEAEATKAQAAKDRLRAKLKTPLVQQDLAIFAAKGYGQPGQGGTGVFEKTDVFGPVSYTRLVTGGYLDSTPDGLRRLLRLGAEPAPGNDRPRWKFAPHRLDQSNEAFLKRVQGLLVELGPVMVEDGLLAR